MDNPSELPEVAVDYMYLGDDTSSEVLSNIVGKDRRTGCFCGSTVENKGRNQYAMTYMVGWIRSLGYKRIVLRSDGEPSLVALLVSALYPPCS